MEIIKNYLELCDYKCNECGGTGGRSVKQGDYSVWRECDCQIYKRIAMRIRASHIEDYIDKQTFGDYIAKSPWQNEIKQIAIKYTDGILNGKADWFYIGGQIGCGKTHIAVAIIRELFYRGAKCKYAMWRELAHDIKTNMWDGDYGDVFDKYASVDYLCIDDFFKGGITDGDKNIAYDVINARYVKKLPTIITSEKTLDGVNGIDEAVASRIKQMCNAYVISVGDDHKKNVRLDGEL